LIKAIRSPLIPNRIPIHPPAQVAGIKPIPVELQPRLRVAFAAGVPVGVAAGRDVGDREAGVQDAEVAVGGVMPPLDHAAAGIQHARHIVVRVVGIVIVSVRALGQVGVGVKALLIV
jgi:hypothetical protein